MKSKVEVKKTEKKRTKGTLKVTLSDDNHVSCWWSIKRGKGQKKRLERAAEERGKPQQGKEERLE
jgi:hypothetical protein